MSSGACTTSVHRPGHPSSDSERRHTWQQAWQHGNQGSASLPPAKADRSAPGTAARDAGAVPRPRCVRLGRRRSASVASCARACPARSPARSGESPADKPTPLAAASACRLSSLAVPTAVRGRSAGPHRYPTVARG